MITERWFVLTNGTVDGPFKTAELEMRLSSFSSPLVWGRGQTEWLAPDKWRLFTKEMDQRLKQEHQRSDRQWRLLVDGQEQRPMSHDQMIQFLQGKADLSNVRVWTEGYDDWKEIFQIHKIMDELGVSRRTHPRVPIMGTLTCEGSSGKPFVARLLSISQGGLGATEGPIAKIGDHLKVLLKSPNLQNPIKATVEVVYVGQDGYFGMRFLGLQSEAKSMVIEYIRKFGDKD